MWAQGASWTTAYALKMQGGNISIKTSRRWMRAQLASRWRQDNMRNILWDVRVICKRDILKCDWWRQGPVLVWGGAIVAASPLSPHWQVTFQTSPTHFHSAVRPNQNTQLLGPALRLRKTLGSWGKRNIYELIIMELSS